MIAGRYLTREICKPFASVLAVMAALFASYSLASTLASALDSLLPIGMIAEIVALKLLISLEVLIPIALFAGVVLGLGRLYSDSEITAMASITISRWVLLGAVLTVSGYMAVGVGALSLIVRPWAYQQLGDLGVAGGNTLNTAAMVAGTFYAAPDGTRVIYLNRRNGQNAPAQAVFVWLKYADHVEVVHAGQAIAEPSRRDNAKVDLTGTHIYDLGYAQPQADRVVNAESLLVDPSQASNGRPRYMTASMNSARLAASNGPKMRAELQWRLSTPVSTLLLGMFGLPLSRTAPRQSQYARFGAAILVYSVYYLICMSARSLVEQGVVPGFPGIWWAPALLGAAWLALWLAPAQRQGA